MPEKGNEMLLNH